MTESSSRLHASDETPPEPIRVYLGLGSNLGNRLLFLQAALESLDAVVAVSPVYETAPIGGPSGQAAYLNAVISIDTSLSPRALLGTCRRLESAAERVRAERWGPRTLDVDILLYGDWSVREADLEIPHPRMWERNFVTRPLADIAPALVPEDLDASEGSVVLSDATLIGPESRA